VEYQTIMRHGVQYEAYFVEEAIRAFANRECQAYVLFNTKSRKLEDGAYSSGWVLLSYTHSDSISLSFSPGDKVSLFATSEAKDRALSNKPAVALEGVVRSMAPSFQNLGDMLIFVEFSNSNKLPEAWQQAVLKNIKKAATGDVDEQPVPCWVLNDINDIAQYHMFGALDLLKNDNSPKTQAVNRLLLGRDLSDTYMEPIDIFKGIDEDVFEDHVSQLGQVQQSDARSLRAQKSLFSVVIGPPGTGKTTLASVVALLNTVSSQHAKTLIATPSNVAANEACRRVVKLAEEAAEETGIQLRVCRLQSNATARDKIRSVVKATKGKFLASQPQDFWPDNSSLAEAAATCDSEHHDFAKAYMWLSERLQRLNGLVKVLGALVAELDHVDEDLPYASPESRTIVSVYRSLLEQEPDLMRTDMATVTHRLQYSRS